MSFRPFRPSFHRLLSLIIVFNVIVYFVMPSPAMASSPFRPDVLIADFNGTAYPNGWVTTGLAFGTGPTAGTLPNQNIVTRFGGSGLVNSFRGGDNATGTITSPTFTMSRRYLRFLIGGGTGGWGHILVDDTVLTDRPLAPLGDPLVKAMAAIDAAVPIASADPSRPVYHFHSPAQWMNDPNGFIFYNGWFHMFYQFNPYADTWGHMHWGHARSRDLVNWQQLPVAIAPSIERGEEHVFSGSVFRNSEGTPTAFYTSISTPTAPRDPEVWAAIPTNDGLIKWNKLDREPVISEQNSDSIHIDEWRDPFLVADHGVTYLVTGGEINGRGVVCLYRAQNGQLTKWSYRGILFQYPDTTVRNIECPNLFKVGDKWALLMSVNNQVEYFTGSGNLAKCSFAPIKHGVLESGSYASQVTSDGNGRPIEFAWIRPIGGKDWAGCFTLPNVVTADADGTLVIKPIENISSLRSKTASIDPCELTGTRPLPESTFGTTLEISAEISPGTASIIGFLLRTSKDGTRSFNVSYNVQSRVLSVPGLPDAVVPLTKVKNTLTLSIYLDRALLDIYGDGGRIAVTGAPTPAPQPRDLGVSVYSVGGTAKIEHLTVYQFKPTSFDMATFHL
jgi:beta-fructofuranosidase